MRILFATKRITLKRFVGVVRELAGRGHEVVIAYPSQRPRRLLKRLRGVAGVSLELYDEVSDPAAADAVRLLRHARDYVWYLGPELAVASFNRRRALDWLVQAASRGSLHAERSWPDPVVDLDPSVRDHFEACLAELEAKLPPDPGVVRFLAGQRPDVVLVSPLVRSPYQPELVKAARSLGIPTAGLVLSWDSLSNKERIHVAPDRLFVWNEVQRREAAELHGLDPGDVVAAGAPHWDGFFAMRPGTTREAFLADHGFDPDEPVVLYLGSTNEVCPDEPAVVDEWLRALRASPGRLSRANVLVRRHPREEGRWRSWTPAATGVSVSSRPHRAGQDLYDQLHHASAVVGLNTSAQIEAAIVGRPVYTFSAGEAAPAQGGSRHFYYLLEGGGGGVTYADSLEEHVTQLERGVGGDYDREAIARFAELFVRPRGLERRVAPIVAGEVLALAGSPEASGLDGRPAAGAQA